ncbi:AAA family ATPase [Lysinibacillus capsici]|uniref:AAA family ATPase n=1 Tax=Lysinibacillus capsici TaxID=2115968 RepID=UPI0028BE512A|nr:AAA family ATPase [Lysinibacillus capsici]WNN77563.1 AAA family ATPase [Lysinibacillus capsici]
MTQYSYSRVSLFEDCPYHFKLRYIDKLTELPNYDAANALTTGKALHTGIEHDVQMALDYYYKSFPVLTDRMVEEAIKLEILIPKVQAFLNEMFDGWQLIHEYEIDKPNYKGFVDLIAVANDGQCMVIDFKYSNHIKNYLDSGQLHIYKDYLEQDGFKVKKLAYLFVPKTSIKQKKDEDLFHFRKRLISTLDEMKVTFVPIEFNEMKTIYFLNSIEKIETAKEYPKNTSGNCFGCNPRFAPDYLEAITNDKGEIIMALSKNERRERLIDTKPDLWLYADSYVGKSTFVDNFPNVLFFNTDGNTDNTTAPVIPIKDEVTKTGRVTTRKLAWEVFLDRVADLETEDNTFETVAIDLVEDLKEHCRIFVFEKNGWEHESDGSYGKGWDKVKTEFNNAIKRLKSLGYQVVYISKEIINEVTLKGGAKRTTYRPNIDEKTANFLTGTVDLTIRAFVNSDDERFLQLAKKQNVFGGGRFDFQVDTIPLDYEAFIEELKMAQEGKATHTDEKSSRKSRTEDEKDATPKRERSSRKRKEDEDQNDENSVVDEEKGKDEEVKEEKPSRQRRDRSNDDAADDSKEDDKPRERKRRERKPVEDDTPPGEKTVDEPAEEPSSRRRRRRS